MNRRLMHNSNSLFTLNYKEEKVRKKIAILFVASLMLVATGIPAFADVPDDSTSQNLVAQRELMNIPRNGNPICQCSCEGMEESSDSVVARNGDNDPRNIHYPCWCDCGQTPGAAAQ